jgi:tRNA (uracil-5-)-methyltransferase
MAHLDHYYSRETSNGYSISSDGMIKISASVPYVLQVRTFALPGLRQFASKSCPPKMADFHSRKRSPEVDKRHEKDVKRQKSAMTISENKQRMKQAAKDAKKDWPDISKDDVLITDIKELLSNASLDESTLASNIELKIDVDVTVTKLSSTGDGLAVHPDSKSVFVVPFGLPGDTVTVRPYRHSEKDAYFMTNLVKVTTPSPQRDDSQIQCPYFTKCSGCQFQMLSYADQLSHKKTIVEKAFRNFSGLHVDSIPAVRDTMASPLQYGYRTKLTPHFDAPPGANSRKLRKSGIRPTWESVPPIGFNQHGNSKVLDIEDCPIGTDAVRRGMKRERGRVAKELDTFKRGATLLLRESTKRVPKEAFTDKDIEALRNSNDPAASIATEHEKYIELKSCITDQKATSKEFIDDFGFFNPAGAFFQNNNSILSPFINYIREEIKIKGGQPEMKYLVDAYCGSGLFTITLSSQFEKSVGIDISPASIEFAAKNAKNNDVDDKGRTKFVVGNAEHIFKHVSDFPARNTAVVVDPPRKGCDRSFLSQLLTYGPERIVYVSCNVHTQARDVGYLVKGLEGVDAGFGVGVGAYNIESLRGFDFFPQTGHVEGVAVLRKKSRPESPKTSPPPETNSKIKEDGEKTL